MMISCSSPKIVQAPRIDPLEVIFGSTVAFMDDDTTQYDEDVEKILEDESIAKPAETTYNPYCSGVWVSRDLILTANHCAAGITMIKKFRSMGPVGRHLAESATPSIYERSHTMGVEMNFIVQREANNLDEKPKLIHKGKVVASNPAHDLALVKVDSLSVPQHQIAQLSKQNPRIASDLMTVGNPGGIIFSISKVTVAGYREHISRILEKKGTIGPFIQVTGPIWRGNSGGGLFNESGDLVGIIAFIAYAPGQCFSIPIISIKEFLDKNLRRIYL